MANHKKLYEWWIAQQFPRESITIDNLKNMANRARDGLVFTGRNGKKQEDQGFYYTVKSFLKFYCESASPDFINIINHANHSEWTNHPNIQVNIKYNANNQDKIESTGMSPNQADQQPSRNLDTGKNLILYGPPGTGKTHSVIDYCHAILNDEVLDEDRSNRNERKRIFDNAVSNQQVTFITFHQSYSYEEFVEGISAKSIDGKITYAIKDGIFKTICKVARINRGHKFILVIDEINRGNISKIFGELITLIEPSKRDCTDNALNVTLPYSQESFSVPENLYIIGTMNTADRSLALIDTALRRRFDFIEMMPKPELLTVHVAGVNLKDMLTCMNERIEVLYDREHTLGHALFMHLNNDSSIDILANVFKNKIIPLLQEYFFDDWEKIRMVLGDDQKPKQHQFILEEEVDENLFSDKANIKNKTIYRLNVSKDYDVFSKINAYIQIYEKSSEPSIETND